MTKVTVYPVGAATSVPCRAHRTAGTSVRPPDGMPASVAADQLYYWSARWQADEAESLAAIEARQVERFSSGRDAVMWLLSTDDEEGDNA